MRKTFVDDSEIAWIECYQTGDTLVFGSTTDSIWLVVDTVCVSNPNNDNPYDWEGRSFLRYFELSDEINGLCKVMLNLVDGPEDVIRSKTGQEWASLSVWSTENLGINFKVGMLFVIDDFNEYGIYERIYTDNCSTDFIVKASDYLSDKEIEQKMKTFPESPVTDFEWSRERGLISFTFNDTTVYRLEKHIHKTEVI